MRKRAWEIGAVVALLLVVSGVITGFVGYRSRNEALSLALDRQEMGQVKALILKGADPNTRSPRGNRALTWAAAWPDEALVTELLDRGARIDAPNDQGATPLLVASGWGNVGVVTLLLLRGANASLKDEQGRTARQHAQEFLSGMQAQQRRDMSGSDRRVASAKRRVDQILRLLRKAETAR